MIAEKGPSLFCMGSRPLQGIGPCAELVGLVDSEGILDGGRASLKEGGLMR